MSSRLLYLSKGVRITWDKFIITFFYIPPQDVSVKDLFYIDNNSKVKINAVFFYCKKKSQSLADYQ